MATMTNLPVQAEKKVRVKKQEKGRQAGRQASKAVKQKHSWHLSSLEALKITIDKGMRSRTEVLTLANV